MSTYTDDFTPTFLYIKRHKLTGLKYFGKTIRKNPLMYLGSGTYWKSHCKKHGKEHVETIWCHLFTERVDVIEFATFFSEFHDVVKSDMWANLITEDGVGLSSVSRNKIHAATKSRIFSEAHRKKLSDARKVRVVSIDGWIRICNAQKGRVHSAETKKKMSESAKERKPSSIETKQKISDALKGKRYSKRANKNDLMNHPEQTKF